MKNSIGFRETESSLLSDLSNNNDLKFDLNYFDRDFYKELVSDFKKFLEFISYKRVLVIGDIMLDRWVKGEVERISPEAPVPVVRVYKEWVDLGGAANVAKILSYYSSNVSLVGFVGNDIYSRYLFSLLKKRKINYNIIKSSKTTIVKTRVIANNNQHIVRVDREDINYSYQDYNNLYNFLKQLNLKDFDIIFFIDYAKNFFNEKSIGFISDFIKSGKSDKFVILCPKPSNFSLFKNLGKINYLSVNKNEAIEIFKISFLKESNLKFNVDLIKKLLSFFVGNGKLESGVEIEDTIITLGKWGLSVFNDRYNVWIDSIRQEVFDVVGAGDNVSSIYGLFKFYSGDILKSGFLANLAGSIAVSKPFTTPVKPNDISNSFNYLLKTNYKNKFMIMNKDYN